MFPPAGLLSPGHFILISDQLAAPADFMLHRFLSMRLLESKQCKCVVVSIPEDIPRWKVVLSKANLNVAQLIDSGVISFVDTATVIDCHHPSSCDSGATRLRSIYDLLASAISGTDTEQSDLFVMVDDLATLEWIGFSHSDIVRFSRALRALCLKANATLIVRHHILTPAEPDIMFAQLLQTCTYHIEVRPLSSGRSGAVSGEFALHPGISSSESEKYSIPRSSALQYRLTDYGAVYFEKGTAGGVL